jgi:hypothetical protein
VIEISLLFFVTDQEEKLEVEWQVNYQLNSHIIVGLKPCVACVRKSYHISKTQLEENSK